jgi:putative N6-adenine-specific DNA methylase
VLRRLPAPVFGADRDPAAVALAARSARRAGLADHVQIAVADLADLEPPATEGLLVANPPYGLRLPGETEARRILREALGGAFRRWRWGVVAAAGSRGEAPAAGLPVSSRKTFRNGGLRLEWVQGRPAEECVLGKRGS